MKPMIREYLERQFGTDDPGMLDDFFREYRTDAAVGVVRLRELLAAGDARGLSRKAHALKGLSLVIGDRDLSDPLAPFELAARSGCLDRCAQLLPELEAAIQLLEDPGP